MVGIGHTKASVAQTKKIHRNVQFNLIVVAVCVCTWSIFCEMLYRNRSVKRIGHATRTVLMYQCLKFRSGIYSFLQTR